MFVAYAVDSPVGIVGCFANADRSIQLIAMWVDPRQRRTGIGRILVRRVVGWARDNGYGSVRLDVADDNKPAADLYRAEGFKPTGEKKPLHSDPARSVSTLKLLLGDNAKS